MSMLIAMRETDQVATTGEAAPEMDKDCWNMRDQQKMDTLSDLTMG